MAFQKSNSFAKFAWFALAYNILVILWGVFLRASYSGDGCGQHWLTCQGEAIPTAPQLKTIIEFSHRITTALAGIVVFALFCWAFAKREKLNYVRLSAGLSFIFIVIEGAIGGGLVLTGNTAANWTPTRPYWTAGHLINTFILIAFLTLAAWSASGYRKFRSDLNVSSLALAAVGTLIIFFVGISGSMAALTTMLFPAESLGQGFAMDFDPASHPLLRLRIVHPIAAVMGAVILFFMAGKVRAWSNGDSATAKWSSVLSILLLVQIAFGAATLLMLGPIVMQLAHLLLADLVWIAFVLMFANYFDQHEPS
jgi:heme A synthase